MLCRNLLSFSDGPRGNSTGRLLFYLTPLDATAIDLMVIWSAQTGMNCQAGQREA